METPAIILDAPGRLALRRTPLNEMGDDEIRVDVHWSGISTGTEKLLWTGQMPDFPGMGYPLVPGYESVGRIVAAGRNAAARIGEWVFVPGANCYAEARGLFGGSARTVILPAARAIPVSEDLGENGILFALAATAHHAIAGGEAPELVIGHGVLGRLIARIAMAMGAPPPVVWDTNAQRREGAGGYNVVHPDDDDRHDYANVYDVSGDATAIDRFIARLARGGELVLAGFYQAPVQFAFPPAFQREARLRIAAEFRPEDLRAVDVLIASGALKLDGLVSNVACAADADTAYPTAFEDPACLKMVLDWREIA